jgi:hypothetical protein
VEPAERTSGNEIALAGVFCRETNLYVAVGCVGHVVGLCCSCPIDKIRRCFASFCVLIPRHNYALVFANIERKEDGFYPFGDAKGTA